MSQPLTTPTGISLGSPVLCLGSQTKLTHTAAAPQGFRPIRVWGSLARQAGYSVEPSEVAHLLRASFTAMVRFGSVVPASSLWMDQAGTVVIVSPDQEGGFTSPAWCMEGLGLMACELLSGAPLPDSISAATALHLAKSGSELMPGGWDPALGFVLQRMLGVVAPYQSIHEALAELDEFYCGMLRPSLDRDSSRVVEGVSLMPSFQAPERAWALPALMGGAAASLLFLVGGGAYWLGARRQPANHGPVVVQAAPAPAVPTVLTLDPSVLEAIKKLANPPPRAAPKREPSAERPTALTQRARQVDPSDDDGPVFVGSYSPSPMRSHEGSGRVRTGDFIARR